MIITAEGGKKARKIIKNVQSKDVDTMIEKLYDQGYTIVTVKTCAK